jgi:photosystem II stability/assembly factor-like uncharacterized protein
MCIFINGFIECVSRSTVLCCLMLLTAGAGDSVIAGTWSNIGPEGGNVKALAVDPQNPAVVYAVTGNAVFKSIDYGDHWRPVNSGLSSRPIYSIAVNPQSPAICYVGTESGVFKSTNGGANWNAANSGHIGQLVTSLAIDPQNPSILYAGTYSIGIFKSTDGGANWSEANNALGRTHITDLAISPQNPSVIYAATNSSGIYKSTNGGESWIFANGILPTLSISALAVDPGNPDIVYTGTGGDGIYKSTDGAIAWNPLNNGLRDYYSVNSLVIDPRDPEKIYASFMIAGVFKSTNGGQQWTPAVNGLPHLDLEYGFVLFDVQTELAINPGNPDIVYAGSDSDGVFRSMNAGMNWSPINSGLIGATISALTISREDLATVYAGTFDKGFRSTGGGSNWSSFGGDLNIDSLAIDPTNPSILLIGNESGVYKSENGGMNWDLRLDQSNTPTDPSKPNAGSVFALTIDPTNPAIVYAGSDTVSAFKSTDNGTNWGPIGLEGREIRHFAINPLDPATLYAATNSGLFKSTDGGANWNGIDIAPSQRDIRLLAIDPIHPETVYAGEYGYIFKSIDGGLSWNRIWAPLGSVQSLVIDPTAPDILYAGTYDGVLRSTNGGEKWTIMGKGPVFSNIRHLAIDPIEPKKIYAGTSGNGVWVYSSGGPSLDLEVGAGGAVITATTGDGAIRTGYASLSVNSLVAPYAIAVFSLKQNGVTVSEAAVPASPPTTLARIFIDYRSSTPAIPARSEAGTVNVNTGIAVVNSGLFPANVTYTLRDFRGATLSVGRGTMAAGEYFACFINQLRETAAADFEFPLDFQDTVQFGSLEINSDQPVSVLGLRGTNNQRNDFLLTTTPIADLTLSQTNTPAYFPQFADGGGNTTSLMLLNASDETETGTLQIRDEDGNPFVVTQAGGAADSFFRYSIPPHGVVHFQTDGFPASTKAGWVQLTPDDGTSTPIASGVFGYNPADVLVSESGIPSAVATFHARVYLDLSGGHNTGLAIASIADTDASISLKAYEMDGVTPAGVIPDPIPLHANGYKAAFADEFISGLSEGFTGVLDISSTTPFAALTLRSLLNERHDFLMTAFPIADAHQWAPSPIVFPQIADGDGYTTQFILLSSGGESASTLSLYDPSGNPFEF